MNEGKIIIGLVDHPNKQHNVIATFVNNEWKYVGELRK